MAFTHALSTNRYGEADLIVSSNASQGTHTTLVGAMADAVSGQTIFLRTSVTENVTLTAGVNISAWNGGTLNTPTITGTLTMTAAGTCNISGIRLVTNSAAFLTVSGSAASIVNLNNCYLNCSNNTGITFSAASTSANINLTNCYGNLGTTGISYWTNTSTGNLRVNNCFFDNTGSSVTASTTSAGPVFISNSNLAGVVSSSSTGGLSITYSIIGFFALNATSVTHNGSGTGQLYSSVLSSGTASALSIGSGATMIVSLTQIISSNTNAITGAGTISYIGLTFTSTSSTINTTTQTSSGILQGSKNTAPSAGFLGESILSTATAVALTSNTAKTVTSISLTAGVWDISCCGTITATGGTLTAQAILLGISTTTNVHTGTTGIDWLQLNGSAQVMSLSVPSLRVTLTATTTYYLVATAVYTSTTCPVNGRINATRVG